MFFCGSPCPQQVPSHDPMSPCPPKSPCVTPCPLTSPRVLLWTPPMSPLVPSSSPLSPHDPPTCLHDPSRSPSPSLCSPVPLCRPMSLCVPCWGPTSPYVPHVPSWAPPVPSMPPMSPHVPSCHLETPIDGLPLCGGKPCRCDPHGPRSPHRSRGWDLPGDEIFAHQILGNMAQVGHGWDIHGGSLLLTTARTGSPGVEVSGGPGHHG